MPINALTMQFASQPSVLRESRRNMLAEQGQRANIENAMLDIENKRQTMSRNEDLRGVFGKAIAGDEAAMQQIAKIDPRFYVELQGKLQSLDAAQRKQLVEMAGQQGRLAYSLRDNPEAWDRQYQSGMLTVPYDQREDFLARVSALDSGLFDVMNKEPPESIQKLEYLMSNPEAMASEQSLRASGATNINTQQEKEESKKYGAALVSGYETIRDDARNAETALQQYQMAKSIDLANSGPLEEWKASAVALAANLGFDPNSPMVQNANNAKAYQGVMQNMVLSKMQAQKGPQTENDAKRIESTLATINNPEEARQFLLDAGMAMEQEKMDKADFWMKWRDTNGSFDGAESAWRKFKNTTPFLAKNPSTGRPVFFSQFVDAVQQANPDADYGDIVDLWRKKYGGK